MIEVFRESTVVFFLFSVFVAYFDIITGYRRLRHFHMKSSVGSHEGTKTQKNGLVARRS